MRCGLAAGADRDSVEGTADDETGDCAWHRAGRPWGRDDERRATDAALRIVLDSLDARQLADFYHRLLGWPILKSEPNWVMLSPPYDGPGLSFQTEPAYAHRCGLRG